MLKWIFKKKEKSAADRDSERHEVSIRVKSRQLPGFRALTLDVSASGLQLETEAQLEKGQILNLELEFDTEELPDFSCPAEVMWSSGDDERRRYSAGLAFRPETDEQKLNTARMGAVLETRSNADIAVLLAEANRIDPTREAFFAQKEMAASGGAAHVATMPMPTAPAAEQPMAAPVPAQTPVQPAKSIPMFKDAPAPPPEHPGVLIPMHISITGYHWDRSSGNLTLVYTEGEQQHQLFFPHCQVCHDQGCGHSEVVVGLYATINSERLREVKAQRGNQRWKHYRFIAEAGEPVLDIISAAIQAQ